MGFEEKKARGEGVPTFQQRNTKRSYLSQQHTREGEQNCLAVVLFEGKGEGNRRMKRSLREVRNNG